LKRILITVAGLCFVPGFTFAQVSTVSGLTVITTPPGAEVALKGEASISGLSPITFTYSLIGEYSLTVKKYGYEGYKTRLMLDPARPQQISVELAPKTGFKAALRSMIIPGWGQRYTDRRTKGFVFSVLFFGAGLTLLDSENKFQDREDAYLARLSEYDAALARGASIDELTRYHAALVDAQQRAYDAEDNRRIAAGVVAGIWGLNVLDALLFAPKDRATFSIKGISMAPSADAQGVRLTLSRAF
jgi:hypothetical protein